MSARKPSAAPVVPFWCEEPWTCEHGREPPIYDGATSWDCLDCGIGDACFCATPREAGTPPPVCSWPAGATPAGREAARRAP